MKNLLRISLLLLMTAPSWASGAMEESAAALARLWNPRAEMHQNFWLHHTLPHLPLDELMLLYNVRETMVAEPHSSQVRQLMLTQNTYQTVLKYFFSKALSADLNSPLVMQAEKQVRDGSTLRDQLAKNLQCRYIKPLYRFTGKEAEDLRDAALANRELQEMARLKYTYDPLPLKGALPTVNATLRSHTTSELFWTTVRVVDSFEDTYRFTDVKVTERPHSPGIYDILLLALKKIVESDGTQTWQQIQFCSDLRVFALSEVSVFSLLSGNLELVLTTPEEYGFWSIKDAWSLQETLRLGLRIPRKVENWVGYLALYHPKLLHPALVSPESRHFLSHIHQTYRPATSYYNNNQYLNAVDALAETLDTQDITCQRWYRFRDQMAIVRTYPSFNTYSREHKYFHEQSDLYRPPAMIEDLMARHDYYKQRYSNNLKCYLLSGHTNHSSGCPEKDGHIPPALYLSRVMYVLKYFEDNRYEERVMVRALCNMQRHPAPNPLTDPEAFWQARYGFPGQHAAGLLVLDCLGDLSLDVESPRVGFFWLDDVIRRYYQLCRPFQYPPHIPERFHGPFDNWVIKLHGIPVVKWSGEDSDRTMVKILKALEDHFDECYKGSRNFPYLPEECKEQALSNYVLHGNDSELFTALYGLCRKRQLRFPNLTGEPRANPLYGDARRHHYAATKWIYENQQGVATFGKAYSAFLSKLQEKYDILFELGIFSPEQCQLITYLSQVHYEVSPAESYLKAIKRVLRKNPATWKDSFASSLIDLKDRTCLRSRYMEELARTIAFQKQPTTYDKVERKARTRWFAQELKGLSLHLPPYMLQDVVQKVTQEEPMSLEQAVICQLPTLYAALLGPGLRFELTRELEQQVALDLLKGQSFGMCHHLNFSLTIPDWMSIAFRMMNIPVEDFNLAPGEYSQKSINTFISSLAWPRLPDVDLWEMAPYDVICSFRKANSFVPLTSRPILEQRQQRYKEGRRAAKVRDRVTLSKIFPGQLPKNHPLAPDIQRSFDYKLGACVRLRYAFNFRIKEKNLWLDPYLRTSPIEQLVPNDVTDEEYDRMRDTLSGIVMCYMMWERAAANPDGLTTEDDWRDTLQACFFVERFFRQAIKDSAFFNNDKPTEPDPWLRRRVANVYNQVFKDLIEKQSYDEVYAQLQTIVHGCNSCIDGARQTLLKMEDHPRMMPVGPAPDVFERLAKILRNLRLDILRKRAEAHPFLARLNDPLEFYLYMCNAYNRTLSLGLEYTESAYYRTLGYDKDIAEKDAEFFCGQYTDRIIETVIRAVRPRMKPAGDNDPTALYMQDIEEWAAHSKHYHNEPNLDEALVSEGKLSYKAAKDLLEDAGYIKYTN